MIVFLYFAFPFISSWGQDIVHGNFSKVCPQGKRVLTATAVSEHSSGFVILVVVDGKVGQSVKRI